MFVCCLNVRNEEGIERFVGESDEELMSHTELNEFMALPISCPPLHTCHVFISSRTLPLNIHLSQAIETNAN